jgi:hypothetical protein
MDGIVVTGFYGLLRGEIPLLLSGYGEKITFEFCACCVHCMFPNITLGSIRFAEAGEKIKIMPAPA